MSIRTRFAPSPTGFMHIGNLRTALYAYLFAKSKGGEFILRIEDTDVERFVEGATQVIYSTLSKAGLEYDEGPDKGGKCGPYVQSERKAIYKRYAEELVARGGAYYCFCDKERLETLADGNGVRKYDKHCLKLTQAEIKKRLEAGEPYVIRQNIPETGVSDYDDLVYGHISVPCQDMEDNILLKSDGMPTYNFANVVDDRLMGITHVMRGTEYLSSTPKYNLVYDCMGWDRPYYMHLPPIMKDAQRKLSKRYGDANFEDFLAKGFLPEAIVNYIALLGWAPKDNEEKMTLERLIEVFNVEGISKSPSVFDEGKLRWLNSLYIKELDFEAFKSYAFPFYEKSVIKGRYDYDKFSRLLQSRIETFGDIIEAVKFIDEFSTFDLSLFEHKKLKTDANMAKTLINLALPVFEGFDGDANKLHEDLAKIAEDNGFKKGQMLFTLRAGLTGVPVSCGGATEMADILGKAEAVRRLRATAGML